jgi:hypothetical protein
MTPFLAARELVELWEHIIVFFVRSAEYNVFFLSNEPSFYVPFKGNIWQNRLEWHESSTMLPCGFVLVRTSAVTCLIFYF